MSWREEVFEVSKQGAVLRGIVTRPDTGSCDMAVILLPAGLKDRVGPHRLYVQLARQLVRPNVLVLRLDAEGIGESDGELDAAINATHYRRIQSGLFVEDTLLAMRALAAREGVRHFVLGGLCGGAISAQLAAAASSSMVAGVLSLSHVAVLDEDQPASARTRSEVVSNNRAYLRKLFSLHAWRRLIAGESEWREIWQNISGLWHLLLEKAGLDRRHWANENPAFFTSFRQLQNAGVDHLMLFGERDARWTAFRELVVEGFLGGAMHGKGYRIEVIPEANHEFYLRNWTQSVLDQAGDWLESIRGSAAASADAVWALGSGKHPE